MGCMGLVMFLWKKFPWEQEPIKHLVIEFILITAYTLVFSSAMYYIEKNYWKMPELENIGMEIFITLLITYLITSIHESVFFYIQWKENFSKSVRLEKDNLEARYKALKAQINPHFLFNSLSGLASLAEGNSKIENYVQDLSGLLRYMIGRNDTGLAFLRDEITFLQKYISLQSMRFPGILEIKIDIPEKYLSHALPALVLQILVENCIKHNIISADKPLNIKVTEENEFIVVTNNLQKKQVSESTGQGLKNISERYKLFTTRKVEKTETDDQFIVKVPLLQVEL